MHLTFSIDPADVTALSRVIRASPRDPARRPGRGLLGWVLLAGLAVACWWTTAHRLSPTVTDSAVDARSRGLVLFAVVSGLSLLALHARHRRRNAVQAIVIDPAAGLTIVGRRSAERVPWADLDRVTESADHFFLHRASGDRRWITLPVRGLADAAADRASLRDLLHAHVMPQAVGFPVIPAVAVAA